MRAIVPLPKGTEVLFSYKECLRDRATRRDSYRNLAFVCNCEMCALPDDLSNALDIKIKKANDAADYLERFFKPQFPVTEPNIIRAVELLDIYMSIVIGERLFSDYTQFFFPLKIFGFLGGPVLLKQIGQAIVRLYRRHLGEDGVTGGTASVQIFTSCLERLLRGCADMKLLDFMDTFPDHPLSAQLEKTASNIISALESLP
jgi:hypothetical protein